MDKQKKTILWSKIFHLEFRRFQQLQHSKHLKDHKSQLRGLYWNSIPTRRYLFIPFWNMKVIRKNVWKHLKKTAHKYNPNPLDCKKKER